MEKIIFVFCLTVIALLGSGCSTTSAVLTEQKYEPVRSGVVQYELNNANWITRRNRKDAEEIAADFCDGKFKILAEKRGSRIDGFSSFAPTKYVVSTSADRTDTIAIAFKCLADHKAGDEIVLE